MKHFVFSGRLVMLGFGSIGQGVLPLILRHIEMPRERITIVSAAENGTNVATEHGVRFVHQALTRDNYKDVLTPLLGVDDFLLNLSVDVSSVALIAFARGVGALYLDTCIEPWAGGYTDLSLSPSQRSNYALRESALALRRGVAGGPTAVLTHGANPGLVSHFVKEALLTIARDTGAGTSAPRTRARGGRRSPKGSVSRRSISQSATRRQRTSPSIGVSSSTPGRWMASSAKAASRPNSAGERTRRLCRRTGAGTNSAAVRQSI